MSLKGDDDVLTIGLNRAVELVETAIEKKPPSTEIGVHPKDSKPISVGKGRFGPYVRHGKTFASLPKGMEMDAVTLEKAIELIDAKLAKAGNGKTAKATKASAKKPAKKKAPAKKKPAKKAAKD